MTDLGSGWTIEDEQMTYEWCRSDIEADHSRGRKLSDEEYERRSNHGICLSCKAEATK